MIKAQEPLTDESAVADKTLYNREQVWSKWVCSCNFMKVDPEDVWVALVEEKPVEGHPASQLLTQFLRKLVQNSNSANTIRGAWKALRGAAKIKVLDPLVKQFPERRYKYAVGGKEGDRLSTPTWVITKVPQWISDTLPELEGLTREQTFTKKEMTPEDVMLLLRTLWSRAIDIPCRPTDRAGFHSAVLMLSVGGFRPGTTLKMPYRDVKFVLVRDPKDRSKVKLVANITIHQNKQRAKVIRENQKHM
ncbi:hypothetical protein F4810DRAFT_716169 [Camillea tinctor]|nr:hypothetical protein F4810DRAFT_716169 [Camillea tinctor]